LSSTGTATDWVSKSDLGLVDGSGTANFVSKWSDTDTLTNSLIFDNGTNVGIGTSAPSQKLQVVGTVAAQINIDGSDATGVRIYGSGTSKRVDFTAADGSVNERISGIGTGGVGVMTFSVNNAVGVLTERVRITSAGDVGIGTTSPSGKLHISAPSGVASLGSTALAIRDSVAPDYGFDFTLEGVASGDMSLVRTELNVQSQVMTFKRSNGNVGIGTSSPAQKLHVWQGSSGVSPRTDLGGTIIAEGSTRAGLYILTAGTDAGSYGSIWWGNGNTNTDASIQVNNSTRAMQFYVADVERLRITSAGNVGIGTSNPVDGKLCVVGTTAAGNAIVQTYAAVAAASTRVTADGRFAIGLDLADGSTERVSITSTGNVGIGTTSPAQRLSVENSASTNPTLVSLTGSFGTSRGASISLANDDLGAEGSALKFTTNVASPYGGYVFSTQGGERVRILSGGGITFNGDTAAANALDDYEEGTWTPTVSAKTGSYTTVTSQRGTYTKIGRQVTVRFYFIVSDKGSGTGGAQITNLPFAALATTAGDSFIGGMENTSTGNLSSVSVAQNSTTASILKYDGTDPIGAGQGNSGSVTYFV
jgi:hypothetical protein